MTIQLRLIRDTFMDETGLIQAQYVYDPIALVEECTLRPEDEGGETSGLTGWPSIQTLTTERMSVLKNRIEDGYLVRTEVMPVGEVEEDPEPPHPASRQGWSERMRRLAEQVGLVLPPEDEGDE